MQKEFLIVIKNKKFMALWLSQFFSQIAVNSLNFLIILKIFGVTHSTLAASMVWLVFIIPTILLGPFAAAYVDLVDRKKILMVTNIAQALILVVLALIHGRIFYLGYGMVFLYSIFNQFYIPSEVASLPILVDRKDLHAANGLFLTTYQLGLVIGFGASGIIEGRFGFTAAFLLAAALEFAAFLSVLTLSSTKVQEKIKKNYREELKRLADEVVEGVKFLVNDKKVLIPFVTITVLQVTLAVVFVNLPAISEKILKVSPSFSGLYIVFPAAAGAAVGIMVTSRLFDEKWTRKRVVKWALGLISFDLIIFNLIVPAISSPYRIFLVIFLTFIIGLSFIGVFIPAQTQLQVSTPDRLMGRVFGNSWFLTTVATVIPMMFSATVTDIFGVRVLFALLSLIFLVAFVLFNRIVDIKI